MTNDPTYFLRCKMNPEQLDNDRRTTIHDTTGARVYPSHDEVLAAVEAHQPATVEQLRDVLGITGHSENVRNRLLDLSAEGKVIDDEGWPRRYAINESFPWE